MNLFVGIVIACLTNPLKNQGIYQNGAVAADHPLASISGSDILKSGGNCVDAAIATAFALSVVRPHSCGIGGGGLAVGFQNKHAFALVGRETCPSNITHDFYLKEKKKQKNANLNPSKFGALAIAVPGFVPMMLALHKEFGSLSLEKILNPSINLAENGFVPDEEHCKSCELLESRRNNIAAPTKFYNEWIWETFCNKGEYRNGKKIKQKALAQTLKKISREGEDGWEKLSLELTSEINRMGGVFTYEDLLNYRPVWSPPIVVNSFFGGELLLMPPPSSGGIAIAQMLGILQKQNELKNINSHVLVESMKHAFANRASFLADDRFNPVNRRQLLNPIEWDCMAKKIDLKKTFPPEHYGNQPQIKNDSGTSHLCVADNQGNGISMTLTINTTYGSLVGSESLGVIFNNEMDDFTTSTDSNAYGLYQSSQNTPDAGKWPLSSMSPTIFLKNNKPMVLVGASGGPKIITSTLQVILNILSKKDSPAKAIQRPRLHHQWKPNIVLTEKNLSLKIINDLKMTGHDISLNHSGLGRVQAIVIDDVGIKPASDPRKGGSPSGW